VRRFVWIAAGLLALGADLDASAATIRVNWSGTVTTSSVPSAGAGDLITGVFYYDDTAAGQQFANFTSYSMTGHRSLYFLNGLWGTMESHLIRVFDDSFSGDQFDSGGGLYTGDLIDGRAVTTIFVRLSDSSAAVFSDESLPSFLDPADFDNLHEGRLGLDDGGEIGFLVDTFTFSVFVPEPAAVFLLAAAGLASCGLYARRGGLRGGR
jgi:hypothetical protein